MREEGRGTEIGVGEVVGMVKLASEVAVVDSSSPDWGREALSLICCC